MLVAALSRIKRVQLDSRALHMKLATVDDALPDLERRLTDALSAALSDGECARLEFAARLAFALEAEIADLMTQAARRPASLPPPADSVRRGSWWPWRWAG